MKHSKKESAGWKSERDTYEAQIQWNYFTKDTIIHTHASHMENEGSTYVRTYMRIHRGDLRIRTYIVPNDMTNSL